MMKTPTIMFDSIDSKLDFDFVLMDYHIQPAKLKTSLISIPGRSSPLDITEYLGKSYDTREIKMTFNKCIDISEMIRFQSQLENIFNGKRMKVTFSSDPDYHWDARVSIESISKIGLSYIEVKLKCIANPYKIHKDGTEVL